MIFCTKELQTSKHLKQEETNEFKRGVKKNEQGTVMNIRNTEI